MSPFCPTSGSRLADDGVTLIPVEDEQAVIGEIAAMRVEGRTFRHLARELTHRGVPARKGNAARTHQAVAGIVRRLAKAAHVGAA
jgi:hypothetical protein